MTNSIVVFKNINIGYYRGNTDEYENDSEKQTKSIYSSDDKSYFLLSLTG